MAGKSQNPVHHLSFTYIIVMFAVFYFYNSAAVVVSFLTAFFEIMGELTFRRRDFGFGDLPFSDELRKPAGIGINPIRAQLSTAETLAAIDNSNPM